MTTATKTKATRTRNKASKRDQLVQDLSQLKMLGECVCWTLPENRGKKNSHQQVVKALIAAGLDDKLAKAFLPAQAFNRACGKLKDERVIDIVRDDKDEILFQFSRKETKDDIQEGDQEVEWKKETKILLHKTTGDLNCKNPVVLEQAKRELDRCLEERTTSDVSSIVTKLFESHSDLIPIGTGVYFVPEMFTTFTDKIHQFLKELDRKIHRLPVPAGTNNGDQSVQEAITSHLQGLLEEMEKQVDGFSVTTRPDTLAGSAEKINSIRTKAEAYAVYLKDKSEELLGSIEVANEKLVAKIEGLNEERKNLPPNDQGPGTLFGYKVTRIVHWAGKNKWSYAKIFKALTTLGVLEGSNEKTLKTAYSDGKNPTYCRAPDLAADLIEKLEIASN